MTSRMEYPAQYLEGIRLFNQEEFFACHDVFEELWSESVGEETRYLQGLIQAAVALYHFGNENLGGARKLYHGATDKLTPYAPRFWSVDVQRFLEDFQRCFQELLIETNVYPQGVRLRDELVPKINLVEDDS